MIKKKYCHACGNSDCGCGSVKHNATRRANKEINTVFTSIQQEVMRRAQQFADAAREQNMTNEEFCKEHLKDQGLLNQFKLKFAKTDERKQTIQNIVAKHNPLYANDKNRGH